MNTFQNVLAQILALGLSALKDQVPAVNAFTFNPDLQGQKVTFGSTISVRVATMKDAEDFDPAVGFDGQATAYEKFPVTIDKAKKVEFEINLAEASADANLQQIVQDSAAIVTQSLGLAITKALLAEAGDATNFEYQKVIDTTSGDYDDIVSIGTGLDNALAFGPRTLLVNPTLYGEFLGDDRVIASNTNSGATTMRSGVLTDIAGFTVAKTTGLPAGCRGIATNKSALCFVPLIPVDMQSTFNLPKVAETGIYTDESTGISMYWQAWFDPNKVKARVAALLFFGVGVCREDALIRIVKAGEDVEDNLPVDPSEA